MNLAYIAGFFDGEGCVNFGRARTLIFPRVLVVNTNKPLLDELARRFGGDVFPLAGRRAGWKQGWQWRLSWAHAVDFLEAIHPYMHLKHEQAQTVFAWAAIAPGQGGRWDQDALALLRERLTWLNAKGPTSGVDPIDAIALNVARKAKKKAGK